MKFYSGIRRRALHARNLLKDWAGEGSSREQYQRMEKETVLRTPPYQHFSAAGLVPFPSDHRMRRRRAFLRRVSLAPGRETTGAFCWSFAAVTYAAAEIAVVRARLLSLRDREASPPVRLAFYASDAGGFVRRLPEFLVPAAGVIASLWIWHRFGLPYAFLAAMIFVIWLSDDWTSPIPVQHLIVAAIYAAGLAIVAACAPAIDSRSQPGYSIVEALLWLASTWRSSSAFVSDLLRSWVDCPQPIPSSRERSTGPRGC